MANAGRQPPRQNGVSGFTSCHLASGPHDHGRVEVLDSSHAAHIGSPSMTLIPRGVRTHINSLPSRFRCRQVMQSLISFIWCGFRLGRLILLVHRVKYSVRDCSCANDCHKPGSTSMLLDCPGSTIQNHLHLGQNLPPQSSGRLGAS